MNLLDLIFPKKCVNCGRIGAYLCLDCTSKVQPVEMPVCPVCAKKTVSGATHPDCRSRYGLDGLIAPLKYRGPVKKGIGKIKYRWVSDIAETFVALALENIWRFETPKKYIFVPIPLHSSRMNWRGFNQAELICQILAEKLAVKWQPLLVRNRNTKTQVGLSTKYRKENIKNAFVATGTVPKSIILVDDVYTTGATMAEACRVLKMERDVNVWAMVLALD